MATTLMVVEGLLRRVTGGGIIPEGARLYNSMKYTGHVVLITEAGEQALNSWLELEGLPYPDFTLDYTGADPRQHEMAINWLRRKYPVDLLIDVDPERALSAIGMGINTLLFTHAQFARPDWRPDTDNGAKPWDEIRQRVEEDIRTKAADKRLQDEE